MAYVSVEADEVRIGVSECVSFDASKLYSDSKRVQRVSNSNVCLGFLSYQVKSLTGSVESLSRR